MCFKLSWFSGQEIVSHGGRKLRLCAMAITIAAITLLSQNANAQSYRLSTDRGNSAGGGDDIDVPDTIIWDLDGGNVGPGGGVVTDFIIVDSIGSYEKAIVVDVGYGPEYCLLEIDERSVCRVSRDTAIAEGLLWFEHGGPPLPIGIMLQIRF